MTRKLAEKTDSDIGTAVIRHFPDGESYVRIETEIKDREVTLVCSMHLPDAQFLPLYFMANTARKLGASGVKLVAPYLAYMRQDKVFQPGEAVTSDQFAALISGFIDELITIDPHLHRHHRMAEIYSIPTRVGHAAKHISKWIRENLTLPVLIGPDGESEQWVSEVAKDADAPFTVLTKVRHGDRDVNVSIPQIEQYQNHTPVLVDDIISTGKTMQETIYHLKNQGMKPPVCIGVHAVFSGNSYKELWDSGASDIVTCNTIPHESNRIDISDLLV